MSIFNPWGELRALKARLAAEEQAYRIEEAEQQRERDIKDNRLLELERINAILRRDNEDLRRELKEAVSRGVDLRNGVEQQLAAMTAERNKADNALKRNKKALAKFENLENMLGREEGKNQVLRNQLELAREEVAALRNKLLNQDKLVMDMHAKLTGAVLRDPKTGRLLPRKGE